MNTGKVIKFLRQEANLTQDELSAILGVNKSSIQKYESGAVSNLKMETIRTLCEYFRMPPWVFIFPEHLTREENLLRFRYKTDIMENIIFAQMLNSEGLDKLLIYARDLIDCGNYTMSQDEVKISQDEN